MRYLFILNEQAGRAGVHEKLSAELEAVCRARGLDFAVRRTAAAAESTEAIRSSCAQGETRVFACGGDGTFSGIVNAAAEFPEAAVGVIPIGTGNDFVRNFGDVDPFLDPAAQIDGREIRLDLLRCNDRLCANMVNIGFDSEAAKQASLLRRNRFFGEKLAYISGVLLTLIRKPGVHVSARVEDDRESEHELLLIAVANGAFCGGGFRSAPKSILSDGKMDVCMVKNMSRTRFLTLVKHYHDGTFLELNAAKKLIRYTQEKKLSLRFPQVRSLCIDGELIECDRLDISVLPRALRFILPKGAVWTEEPIHEPARSL